MSIITLLGFILCGIIFGASSTFVVLYEHSVKNPDTISSLNDEIFELEKWNLHWKRECERMHHELVRANGSHSCMYCDPRKRLK